MSDRRAEVGREDSTEGGGPAVLLASGSDRRGGLALAASVAVEAAAAGRLEALLIELSERPRRRPTTLLASPEARALEARLRALGLRAAARGHICHLGLGIDEGLDGGADGTGLADVVAGCEARLAVVHLPGSSWVASLELPGLRVDCGLLLARLPEERSLAALTVDELRRCGCEARVASRAPAALAARRAMAGLRPGGGASVRAARLARALPGLAGPARQEGRGGAGGQEGQALPVVLAAAAALVGGALLLAAIGGAVTGKARVQRAADLAALSAARSMRDDMPRLLAPATLPGGAANPRHLARGAYLFRARVAAREAVERNGVAASRLELSFPDAGETPPLRARAAVRAEIDADGMPGGDRLAAEGQSEPEGGPGAGPGQGGPGRALQVVAAAVAEAGPPSGSWTGLPERASGGGYSGSLAYRNGEGMRPDVAGAYDRMAAAALSAGRRLVVNSGFRSDAEQAALFSAHPDPRWVAPPGRSLHRCATELDLGPASAYGWLAANAARFGFLRRYAWEPWHYGFAAGPAPCSAAGESGVLAGEDADGQGSSLGLPSFVPGRYRGPITRAAARWNVSGPLLAAQIMAESGFDPAAVSAAGARGIAQFMPGTAASYGLRNPFDPEAAIDAQAHLMSDLLRRFRSVPLALAAYNAGPGAVAPCTCIPPYPETRAYVARILALLDGVGALPSPPLEVRLVR